MDLLAKVDGGERIDGADMDDDRHAVFYLLHDDFGNFFSLVGRHRRPLAIGTQDEKRMDATVDEPIRQLAHELLVDPPVFKENRRTR
jgi:hypothetical protein